mmetsp:Transcript_17525/g.44837  ORF Transcript_17525/g.44837 Transcript_17525/m.44837 type:complete len:448 (-) Transcript_17525:128-1471(-)
MSSPAAPPPLLRAILFAYVVSAVGAGWQRSAGANPGRDAPCCQPAPVRPPALQHPIADRKEHGALRPKYHLYDPSQLLAYTTCNLTDSAGLKHNVDKLFVQQLLREGASVPPEEANIFIIPALLSQMATDRCGESKALYAQLNKFLAGSRWFRRYHGADHFVVGDNFQVKSSSLPGKVAVGRFEPLHPEKKLLHPIVAVGDSTLLGMKAYGWTTTSRDDIGSMEQAPVKAFEERKYDFSFIGKADSRAAYRHRRELACAWAARGGMRHMGRSYVRISELDGPCNATAPNQPHTDAERPQDEHPPSRATTHLSPSEAQAIMADSKYFLALTGDSPTSDRLFNMFDTGTIPLVLSERLNSVLDALPFPDVVPWRDIFVVVESKRWAVHPLQSVLDAIDALPPDEVVMRRVLMARHADDVSFARPETTRAHTNIVDAAWKAVLEQLKSLM